jgi:hypothetical protein
LRLKHVMQFREDRNPHESYFLKKYYLAYSLDKYAKKGYTQWNFLTGVNFPKSLKELPFYYFDVVELLKTKENLFKEKNITTKKVYSLLGGQEDYNNLTKTQLYWENTFKTKLPWDKIWLRCFRSYAQGPSQNTQWKMFQNILPTKEKCKLWVKNRGRANVNCLVCNQNENTLHPFVYCKVARAIWCGLKFVYEKLLPQTNFNIIHVLFFLNIEKLPKLDPKAKLITTITNIITTELWRSRNLRVMENKVLSTSKIIKNIIKEIKYIWKIKYEKYKRENNIEKFHTLFSINDAISKQNELDLVFTM